MTEVTSNMKTIQVTLPDELHCRAKTLAYQTGMTFVELIRRAIEERVNRLENGEAATESQGRLQ